MPLMSRLPVLAAMGLCVIPALAQNLLINPSFEDLSGVTFGGQSWCGLNFSSPNCTTVPGWASSNTPFLIQAGSGAWQAPSSISGWTAAQGNVLVGLQSDAEIHQTLTLPAGNYLLTWQESHRAHPSLGAPQNYAVTLNGGVLATYVSAIGDPWISRAVNFTTAGGTLSLMFDGLVVGPDTTVFIDNMSLTNVTSVDEPGRAAFMICGLVVLGWLSCRRRTAQ